MLKSLIERECRAVSTLLHNAARDHILDSPTSQRTVKDRVSSMFLTPLKFIRDRLRTTGTSLPSHSSTDSIDELMQLSQCESHCDSQPTWDNEVGDATMAQLSSQLQPKPPSKNTDIFNINDSPSTKNKESPSEQVDVASDHTIQVEDIQLGIKT